VFLDFLLFFVFSFARGRAKVRFGGI
jgi:hypothetical protein